MTEHAAPIFTGNTPDVLPKAERDPAAAPLRRMVELYHSLKGEGTQAGMPMVFVRFAGCNLACSWCDTPYNRVSFQATDDQLFDMIMEYKPAWVVFTGGEPMMQLSRFLTGALKAAGVKMACESNGQVWNEALIDLDYICFSPKREVKEGVPSKFLINPKIAEAVTMGDFKINELRYVVLSGTDTPPMADVESEFITFSPLMQDPDPKPHFKSGDGYGNRFGLVDADSYTRAMELVMEHRHRGARLSVQLHKFIGVR